MKTIDFRRESTVFIVIVAEASIHNNNQVIINNLWDLFLCRDIPQIVKQNNRR